MKLVENHIIKKNKQVDDLCSKSRALYNQALYYWRQSLAGKIESFSEYELTKLFAEFDEKNYRSLPIQTSQQTIKLLFTRTNSSIQGKISRLSPMAISTVSIPSSISLAHKNAESRIISL